MSSILAYEFMKRAFIASVLVGGICSLIGVFVILRGLSFMGAGIAHASFAGATLGMLLNLPPFPFSLVFALLGALFVGWAEKRGELRSDIPVGIVFSSTMALAILFAGLMRRYDPRILGYLFGSVLSVSWSDVIFLLVTGFLVIAFISLFYKEIVFAIFDREYADISRMKPDLFLHLLLIAIALVIAGSLKTVGVILVFAEIVTPAAAAYELTHSMKALILLSVTFGILSSVLGLLISLFFDIPSGASIVLVVTFIFFLSLIFSPKRRRLKEV